MRFDNHRHRLVKNCAIAVLSGVLFTMVGCDSFGSKRVAADRFDYNAALARSSQEQLLSNIVRLRFLDFPTFLSVPSIVASYTYTGKLQAGGTVTNPSNSGSVGANIEYSETPTITYTPLSGDDFSKRLFRQIKPEVIFSLGQSGWPIELLFALMVEIVNNLENTHFNAVMSFSEPVEASDQAKDNAARFREMATLLPQLTSQNLIEFERELNTNEVIVYFSSTTGQQQQKLINEFKDIMNLDQSVNRFTVTSIQMDRKPDEIAMDTRSLFGMLLFLALGVDVPAERQYEGKAITGTQGLDNEEQAGLVPFRVRTSENRPEKSFVAIKYRDYWYYLAEDDLESKFVLLLVLTLFQLEAPESKSAPPILALPVAR